MSCSCSDARRAAAQKLNYTQPPSIYSCPLVFPSLAHVPQCCPTIHYFDTKSARPDVAFVGGARGSSGGGGGGGTPASTRDSNSKALYSSPVMLSGLRRIRAGVEIISLRRTTHGRAGVAAAGGRVTRLQGERNVYPLLAARCII